MPDLASFMKQQKDRTQFKDEVGVGSGSEESANTKECPIFFFFFLVTCVVLPLMRVSSIIKTREGDTMPPINFPCIGRLVGWEE